jgi:hypothetical protein
MIYNANTQKLFTDDGRQLLKKLDCPLHKEWTQLDVIQEDESKRRCLSCQKSVVSLEGMSEEDVKKLLVQSPDCCVYVPPSSPQIKITGRKLGVHDNPCPFRRIHTARGVDAINRGSKEKFWPLVKKVEKSPRISSWMAVYQNEETGEVVCRGDYRFHPRPPWKEIIPSFDFYPHSFPHAIAAYLIPPDLKVGERVFLTDLIEDKVAVFGNQGQTYRLEAAYAIWNGTDFEIQWDENQNAERWIG